jgi:predicted Zn finger-like uncharacterized protein
MQIVCPACAARYDVPEARLAPGKRVQCARCDEMWAPIPADPVEDPVRAEEDPRSVEVEPPAPEPARIVQGAPSPMLPPVTRRGARVVWAGWLLTLVVLASLAYAAHVFRPQIEHAWPPSERLYGLF